MIALLASAIFIFTTSGGSSMPNDHGQAVIESVRIGVLRRLRRVEGGLMLGAHEIEQPKSYVAAHRAPAERAHGVSLSLTGRRRFAAPDGLEPYAEISSGPLWTDRRAPAETSRLNFLTEAGAGVVLERAPIPFGVSLHFGHISNAGLAYHNPGVNIFSIRTETSVRLGYK